MFISNKSRKTEFLMKLSLTTAALSYMYPEVIKDGLSLGDIDIYAAEFGMPVEIAAVEVDKLTGFFFQIKHAMAVRKAVKSGLFKTILIQFQDRISENGFCDEALNNVKVAYNEY